VDHWLGLPDASAGGRPTRDAIRITATCGVRHGDLERVVAELKGEKPSPHKPPTVATNIGCLMPGSQWEEWEFTRDTADAQAGGLVSTILTVGRPVFDSYRTLRDIVHVLQDPQWRVPEIQAAYRVPVGLALLGESSAGTQVLDRHLAAAGSRASNLVQVHYREFAERFRIKFTG
jgi:hypothetical protein